MADAKQPIILKKKIVAAGGGHHGGAWKVAYADFVTAMMAFFLLMWLLNATTEDQRKGIADYFDPAIPISRVSGGGQGMLSGDSVFTEESKARSGSGGTITRSARGVRGSSVDIGAPGAPAARSTEGAGALEDLEKGLQKTLDEAGPDSILSEHVRVTVDADGLKIELVDTGDQPLFSTGSARPSPRLLTLLDVVSSVVGIAENDIAIIGHTDSDPFGGGSYGNWELSTDRAHAARRRLVQSGVDPGRIVEVSGAADTQPLTEDPAAPENRRIAVTLLRDGYR